MASLRRQPARTHRTTANRGGPDTQTAFIAPPARFQEHGHTGPTHAFSTTNLTVISGAGTDSTFSTMATQTDLPGTGRVIDKYVFQPAGRKLEAFIGGIVRSISMRKTARQRRRDSSAALLAGELAEPGATEEVAPPYSTQRTSRPLPQVPEHTNVHSTIMPWLAQTGAYYAQSIQSYPASERVYSPAPTTTYTPYPFTPQPYRNTESVRPIYNAPTAPASTAGDDPSPNLDTSWWGGGAVASSVSVAPPAYDDTADTRTCRSLPMPVPQPLEQVQDQLHGWSSSSSSVSVPPSQSRLVENISPTPVQPLPPPPSPGKLMTFCMDEELVYAPLEPDYEKALTLAKSFFPSLSRIERERIALSLPVRISDDPRTSASTSTARITPGAWAHICTRRDDYALVHVSVLPLLPLPSPLSSAEGMSKSELMNRWSSDASLIAAMSPERKLLTYAYEGEMAYVPSAPDYESAFSTALSAFPSLSRVAPGRITFSVNTRIPGAGPEETRRKAVRVPREAWNCLVAKLPDYEVVTISVSNIGG